MAVFIDVKSRFDDASGRKAAEDAKRYFANAGTSSGDGFMGNFAKAVEKDTKVRAAADKVANSLDKITAAEAKRATQLEKSKAVTAAVAAEEKKLAAARADNDTDAVAAAERQLASLREKQIDIDNKLVVSATNVNRAERDKARAVREASSAYRDMGNDVDGISSKLAKLGSGGGIGGALKLNAGLVGIGLLPAAATAITEVAGAVQQLAGAGLVLPGVFAGIASSVGVGALGMFGMADALEAVNKASDGTQASVDAANKALGDLSPRGAETIKTVAGLKGTFMDLRNIASENLFDGVSDGLRGLVSADLPAVTRGIDGISQGLNQNLKQAMSSLGSDSSQGILDRIFGNTADAQARLTAAIDLAIKGIGTLTAAGTDSLPRLADAVGNVAERFNAFISAADGDGRLATWIDEGLTGFTQLGNTALNIGKSFTALTEAAGGGTGLLGTLESATGKMSTFLNSTDGQTKLQDYFAQGRDMLVQLKDVATSAGPVLAGLFQAGVNSANLWLPVIRESLDILNRIPGGAEGVVTAFAGWKSITAVGDLSRSLSNITGILGMGLPNAAKTGADGITNSLTPLLGAGGIFAALAAASVGIAFTIEDLGRKASEARINAGIPTNTVPAPPHPAGAPWPEPFKPGDRGGLGDLLGATPAGGPAGGPQVLYPKDFIGPIPPGSTIDPNKRMPLSTTPAATPGLSGFNGMPVTDTGSGSGSTATPFIDPSKYMMGDPLAGLPGAVAGSDPGKVYEADSRVISAQNGLEQKKLALQVLEAQGNATQQQLLTAKNDLQEQERTLYNAQADAIKARTGQMQQATTDLQSVFAPLDQDFGISKGIPGIVENLVKTLGNFALGGAIRSSPDLQAAAMSLMAGSGTGSGQAGYATAGYGGFAGGAPGAATAGESARGFAHRVEKPFFESQGLTVGDHGADKYGEHQNGALDIMVGSIAEGNKVLQQVLSDPNTYGAIFNNQTYGYGQGSSPRDYSGGHTGDPSQDHTNHVHAFFKPGGESNISPQAGGGPVSGGPVMSASAGFGAGSGGTQSVFVVNMPGGGFLPGVGGPGVATPGVDPAAIGPAPLGGGVGPTSPMGWGGGGIPSMPAGAGGQGYGIGAPGAGMAGQAAQTGLTNGTGVSAAATPGGQGIGLNDGLMGAAGMAADIALPGSSIALKVANRTVQFAGQAAGILASGALETALPAGSPLAANSWFSKILGGVSGAKAAKPNIAGGQGGNPQQAPPMGSPASGNGAGPAPGPGGGTNITVNNNRPTEDGTGRDIAFHTGAQNQGPGW